MKEVRVSLYGEQKVPWHGTVINDNHRFKVVVAGRKARKTSLMVRELMKGALGSDLTYPLFLPFRKQAKEIVWDDHIPQILNIFNEYGIKYKKNDSDLSIKVHGAGKLVIDGLDNAEAHRGKSNWGGVGLDEWADGKESVWQPIIRPNLSVHKAWGIFGGTPKGYNHFWRLAKLGDHNNIIEGEYLDEEGNLMSTDPDFMTFRYTSYDNPFNDPAEIEAAKRTSDPIWFAQEYLAQFTKFTGLIYKDFDRLINVVKPFSIPKEWNKYRTIDLGSEAPTACLWIAKDHDGNVYIYREYYQRDRATEDHAEDICLMSANEQYTGTIFDHHGLGRQLITDYNRLGVKGTEHKNHEVISGIERVKELLRHGYNGKPKLYVFNNCFNTIREFETYRWEERKTNIELNPKETPLKQDDHTMDCVKNWTVTFYYQTTPTKEQREEHETRQRERKLAKHKVSSITGY